MGNTQSLFYPDNPNRRDRAQQLANDCQSYVDQYNVKHRALDAELGAYKDKVMHVLAAFGCSTLSELDEVVHRNATGQALKDWNDVKGNYDQSQEVDQILMATMGVIAIAGLAISAVGALAGGFGFFAGIAVTGEILAVLGILGAVFDIIEGAVLRSQLRDAINRLFVARVKCKRVLNHIDNLTTWVPTIHILYKSFEDCGYNKDAILALMRDIMKPVKEDDNAETFYKAARDLHDMDVRRGSWTNEDPGWEDTASALEMSVDVVGAIGDVIRALPSYKATSFAVNRSVTQPEGNTARAAQNTDIVTSLPPPPPYEKPIRVVLSAESSVPGPLKQPLHVSLHHFVDSLSAKVHIHTDDGYLLDVDAQGVIVESPRRKIQWTLSFANEADIDRIGSQAKLDLAGVELDILISNSEGFIGKNGRLVQDRDGAAVLHAKYCRD